ncbi:hypothetical protein HEK98_016555 [Escherichia coli]|nr:hypothetical protein [Escherichia coli]HAI4938099.1 hypothetical protein [Escherichia coli]
MSGLTPAAPLAVFCSLPRKLLPVSTGSNMSSQPPYIRSLCPEFPGLQPDGTVSDTPITPNLTAS